MNAEHQTEYIVQALRLQGAMYEDDARKFLAEHDNRVRAEVLTEAKREVVSWLVKKAREDTPVGELASKVDRGAVRIFLGTGHYRDAMDAHRSEVLIEAADFIEAAQDRIEADEKEEHGSLDHETDLQSGAVRFMAGLLRAKANPAIREEATAAAATATPGFFTPGHTYTRTDRLLGVLRFRCRHLDTDPQTGDREAWGWLHREDGTRRMQRMWDDDYRLYTLAPQKGGAR